MSISDWSSDVCSSDLPAARFAYTSRHNSPDRSRDVTIETEEQLELLRRVGGVVAAVCRLMGASLEPGITTRELDEIGRAALDKEGCRSAPILMYNFPGATCISANHAVAHGIPDDTRSEEHTSELQSLMRISYAVFCLKKTTN